VRTPARAVAFLGVLALAALLGFLPPVFAQCSMCQQVVAQSPEAQKMSADLNRAILLMFVAPYVVFSSFALAFFRVPLGQKLKHLVRVFFLPR
jgi:hypothetical protein